MKKNDLKSGMVVELRDGSLGLVVDNIVMLSDNDFIDLRFYNDNLTANYCFDIVKIYNRNNHTFKNWHKNLELIWQRKEVKEMTVEEISKALGYEVKVVK